MAYRYYLDNKRSHGFRKGVCPNCHKKDHFTYYVDRDAPGGPAVFNVECGLCDTPGCYHVHPSQYQKEHGVSVESNSSETRIEVVKHEPIIIPPKYVKMFHGPNNSLIRYLLTMFKTEDVAVAYEKYWLGTTREGFVIWWQIDKDRRVRSGKMMLYLDNGHRDRTEGKYTFDWMHSKLQRKYKDRNGIWQPPLEQFGDHELVQCLFGLHLLHSPANKGKKVAIVESEKSAVICSILLDEYIWMATGGMNNLTYLNLLPIIEDGREIVLFPDIDGYDTWITKATEIKSQSKNANIIVSQSVRIQATEKDSPKSDIADILLRRVLETKQQPEEPLFRLPKDAYEALGINPGDNEPLDLLIQMFQLIPTKNE